jgi:2-iminobutanoate/2-iminopropanoate deaminase
MRERECEAVDVRQVLTRTAPRPIGPYSQAVIQNAIVYCSGQVPIDPTSNQLVEAEIEDQTRQVLRNLRAVLDAAGSSLDRVLRTTVYLTDLGLFPRVNAVYAEFFCSEPPPARSTIEVAGLPLGAQIEIDAIASVGE